MSTVICYRAKKPLMINGKENWESLAWYTYKNLSDAQKEVDELNRTHPKKAENGLKINWKNIEYFFVDQQEEMY